METGWLAGWLAFLERGTRIHLSRLHVSAAFPDEASKYKLSGPIDIGSDRKRAPSLDSHGGTRDAWVIISNDNFGSFAELSYLDDRGVKYLSHQHTAT